MELMFQMDAFADEMDHDMVYMIFEATDMQDDDHSGTDMSDDDSEGEDGDEDSEMEGDWVSTRSDNADCSPPKTMEKAKMARKDR